jgi:dihydroorotate dehydrogenase (fumarate)
MNLKTHYLGFELRNPVVASAGPLTHDVEHMELLEDAGVGAIVMPSLFEEQIRLEAETLHHYLSHGEESFAEAVTYLPDFNNYNAGKERYLETIRAAKQAIRVPLIASLNGFSTGGWVSFARDLQQAGADAIELNIYFLPTNPEIAGGEIEQVCVDIVREVRKQVSIPLAVKLGPYYSSMANMAKRLVEAGANGLVLFNRFYQPDIDLETLEVVPNLKLSTPVAGRLPLRWIAILYGRVQASLAATSGIHQAEDALKMLMVGADVTMMCSALLQHGITHVSTVLDDMRRWMEQHEYQSVEQMKGSMSHKSCPEPAAFERANYIRVLDSYKVAEDYRAGKAMPA